MPAKIQSKDLGYASMRMRLRQMQGSFTKVGVQAGSKESDGVTDLVTVAAANEFGTDTIDERSFIRSTFEENKESLAALSKAEAQAIIEGRKTVENSLQLMGAYHVGQIQAKIHSNIPPPNDQKTIDRKGSSVTLIDSGQLVQSIRNVETIKEARS